MRNDTYITSQCPFHSQLYLGSYFSKFYRQRKDVTSIDVESKPLVKINEAAFEKCQMRLKIKTPQIRIDYLSPC